mgnify:CR=1 FL=1
MNISNHKDYLQSKKTRLITVRLSELHYMHLRSLSNISDHLRALIEKDIQAVLTGVSGAHNLRSILASLDSKKQALLLGHALTMPVVVQTREYDETFYRAMADTVTTKKMEEFIILKSKELEASLVKNAEKQLKRAVDRTRMDLEDAVSAAETKCTNDSIITTVKNFNKNSAIDWVNTRNENLNAVKLAKAELQAFNKNFPD